MTTVRIPCHIQYTYEGDGEGGLAMGDPKDVHIVMPDLDEVRIEDAAEIPGLIWVAGGWLYGATIQTPGAE